MSSFWNKNKINLIINKEKQCFLTQKNKRNFALNPKNKEFLKINLKYT